MTAPRSVVMGILAMVLAGIAVSAEMVFCVAMLQKQWPYWRMTALSCLLCAGVIVATLCGLRSALPTRDQLKWVLLLGAFSAVYWGIGVLAAQLGVGPGDVAALTSINIVAACLLGRLFLDESFKSLHMVAVVLSLAGAVLIAKPSFIFVEQTSSGPWYGYVLAILSGFIQGGFFICGRKAGDVSAGHLATSALMFSVPLCAFLPFLPIVEEAKVDVIAESPWEALFWLGVACLTSIASAFFSCAGSNLCPAAISATVYTAASMVFGYAVQSILFAAIPDSVTIGGAGLMLLAVSLMAFADRPSQTDAQPEASPAEDDDSQSVASFASFVASEFSDFDGSRDSLRFRAPAHQVQQAAAAASQIGLSA